jgi:glycosyltransferase involved in cell wall biosynthesis
MPFHIHRHPQPGADIAMDKLRISVAMCTYNGDRFLRDQLDSIAGQERLPDELVVRDDSSSDGTVEILRAFASSSRFPVRCMINERNIGSTKNFENAIASCSGNIIVLADQDDIWHPAKLARVENIFSSSPRIGAVFSDAEVVDENMKDLGYRLWEAAGFDSRMQRRFLKGNAIEILLKNNVATGATMAFRADYIKLLLPIPTGWVHDCWIALLVSFLADLEMIPDPLIRYRQHPDNQIGGRKYGFVGKISRSLEIDSNAYLSVADNYKLAYERVSGFGNCIHRDKLRLVAEKANHFYVRSKYSNHIWLRVSAATKEFLSLRYHRYSLGTNSFARDLFFYGSSCMETSR